MKAAILAQDGRQQHPFGRRVQPGEIRSGQTAKAPPSPSQSSSDVSRQKAPRDGLQPCAKTLGLGHFEAEARGERPYSILLFLLLNPKETMTILLPLSFCIFLLFENPFSQGKYYLYHGWFSEVKATFVMVLVTPSASSTFSMACAYLFHGYRVPFPWLAHTFFMVA
jgi:hypothetical protein